jgi:hypothetical protein
MNHSTVLLESEFAGLDQLDAAIQHRDLLAGAIAGLTISVVSRRYEFRTFSGFTIVFTGATTILSILLSLDVSHAFRLGFVCIWTLIASILLYRLSPLHPLYHIPGPVLDRCTQLVQFYQLAKGRPRVYQQRLHLKYGPVVRIGPNEVSICDTPLLSSIFGAKPWLKGTAYSFTASGGAKTSETALSSIRDRG